MAKIKDEDRSRKTLYVTGFDRKRTTKDLLKELFMQGGPVVDITMFDTHAYVLFQHEESVPYCLALFNDIELHGSRLRISPRFKTKSTFAYLDYLIQVRRELRDRNMRQTPPDLPSRTYPDGNTSRSFNHHTNHDRRQQYNGQTNSGKRKNKKSKSRKNRGNARA